MSRKNSNVKLTRRHGGDTVGFAKLPTCEATSKRRYRDTHQARHALQGAQRQAAFELVHRGETKRHEVRIYACSQCSGFHLTSEPRRSSLFVESGPAHRDNVRLAATRRIATASSLHFAPAV